MNGGPRRSTPEQRPRLAVSTLPHDAWPVLTWSAGALVGVGLALAVFGLPGVSVHGPLHAYGIMDPLCGATRAVRLALRGELAASWAFNPLGAPLVALSVLALGRAVAGLTSGRWVTVTLRLPPTARAVLVALAVVVLVALEINQQAHDDLLVATT